ncbi:hypothetical protein AAC387_Pa01g4161 [Persea americana]
MAEKDGAPTKSAPPRPTIDLPPRENFFFRGANASPGPMTLVSSFFSENDPDSDCRSFSQLLAGAMSPGVRWPKSSDNSAAAAAEPLRGRDSGEGRKEEGFRSNQNRPMSLVMAAQSPGMFTIPAGLSPGCFLDSPGLFSSGQGHFGMISHQQALAQVTAQAAQSQSHIHTQADYPPSLAPPMSVSSSYPTHPAATTMPLQKNPSLPSDAKTATVEALEVSRCDQRSQPPVVTVDKPNDDGYNWRKYGQKQVKGSEYPRSYYKCSHPDCPVKKKIERSVDGQVTEIIYKGAHTHQKPQQSRRAKEGGLLPSGSAELNGRTSLLVNSEIGSQGHTGNFGRSEEIVVASSVSKREQESGQVISEQLSGSSDGEEVADAEVRTDAVDDNEPDLKKRCIETKVIESTSHRTVQEPRIIVQTTSEVDLLDDGYRWRKYGQKVVKGNSNPRSYYKCTNSGCTVRKHVERASADPKAVITTYEGKHNHDVPIAKNSSHNTASNVAATNSAQLKSHNKMAYEHTSVKGIGFRNDNVRQPVSLVQMKEER